MARQKKEEISIWSDKKIPPLEFATIQKTAKLLDCDVDDLWHWKEIGAIDFGVRSEGGDFAGWVKPKKPSDRVGIIEDYKLNVRNARDIDQACLKIGAFIDSVDVKSNPKDAESNRIQIYGRLSGGVWLFREEGLTTTLKRQGRTNTILYNNFESKKANYMLYLPLFDDIEVKDEGIYIMRSDIEALYSSIQTGDLPNKRDIFDNNIPPSTNGESNVREGKLGEFIESLLCLIPDIGKDVLSMNPNKRQGIIESVYKSAQESDPSFNYKPPTMTIISKYLKI